MRIDVQRSILLEKNSLNLYNKHKKVVFFPYKNILDTFCALFNPEMSDLNWMGGGAFKPPPPIFIINPIKALQLKNLNNLLNTT